MYGKDSDEVTLIPFMRSPTDKTWWVPPTKTILLPNTAIRIAGSQGDSEVYAEWLYDNAWVHLGVEKTILRNDMSFAAESVTLTRINRLFLLEFLNALSCSNVAEDTVSAPKGVYNDKKSANVCAGTTVVPKYITKTLTISVPSKKSIHATREKEGGTVREHLRRGHIRSLHDGRKVWVSSCVVAAGSANGKIEKDYKIKGYQI
jgi:hypothetical protein